MAFPRSLIDTFLPEELEFAVEEDEVEIVPLFRMDSIRMIAKTYGPFRPPARTTVPIWLAVTLKKKRKCRILCPEWMTVESLEEYLKAETSEGAFSGIPFQYMETSRVLLEAASDDIPQPEKVRSLLKDLREARQSKTRPGLEGLDNNNLEMNNLSQLEINEIRPFFTKAWQRLLQLDPEALKTRAEEELLDKRDEEWVRSGRDRMRFLLNEGEGDAGVGVGAGGAGDGGGFGAGNGMDEDGQEDNEW